MDNVKMAKVLKLKFKTGEGSTKIMTIAHAKDDLKKEEVKEAMQKIADSKVFVKDGIQIYATPVSAYTILTNTSTVFNAEEVATEEVVAD